MRCSGKMIELAPFTMISKIIFINEIMMMMIIIRMLPAVNRDHNEVIMFKNSDNDIKDKRDNYVR